MHSVMIKGDASFLVVSLYYYIGGDSIVVLIMKYKLLHQHYDTVLLIVNKSCYISIICYCSTCIYNA